MQFTLTITLGNDAMQTLDDVITALRKSRKSLADGDAPLEKHDRDVIWDDNGNTIGEWEVTDTPSLQDLDPVDGKRFYRVSRGYDAVVAVPEDADKWAIREAANNATGEDFLDADYEEISRDEYLADSGEDDDTDGEDEEDEDEGEDE